MAERGASLIHAAGENVPCSLSNAVVRGLLRLWIFFTFVCALSCVFFFSLPPKQVSVMFLVLTTAVLIGAETVFQENYMIGLAQNMVLFLLLGEVKTTRRYPTKIIFIVLLLSFFKCV